MSIYKDNMSRIKPDLSSGELAAKIARSEKKTSFHGIRRSSAIAAAAAAVMALTLTAGAVSGWDFEVAVRSLFGVETAESVSDKFAKIEVSDYTNEFENVEFNFIGAVSDDIFTTLFLEVTRTDGGVFDIIPGVFRYMEPDGTFTPAENTRCNLFGMDSVPGYDFNHSGLGYHCIEPKVIDNGNNTDNKLTYAFIYDTDMLKEYAGRDDKVTVKYDFYGIGQKFFADEDAFKEYYRYWGEDNEKVKFDGIRGYMGALVTIPFDNGCAVKSVYPEVPIVLETEGHESLGTVSGQKEFTLKSISVSTASVSFEVYADTYEGENHCIYVDDSDFVSVHMKDGTTISAGGDNLDKMRNIIYANVRWRVKYDCMLGRIIDPNDVEAVTINGQTFMLE